MVIKLIANPASGNSGVETVTKVKEYLTGKGATVDLFLTRRRGDAIQAAREAQEGGVDMVVAAGGDGTLCEVINGISGSSIPLGFIPLGTVNVFALETGIPADPLRACDILFNGATKKVHLGRINDSYFLLMAGIGFDADVVYHLNLRLKKLSGRLSYVLTALWRIYRYPWHPLKIELDNGNISDGYWVVIGNVKYYGGRMSITPFADFERDDLDVCIFKRSGILNMVRYIWGILNKKHLNYPDVEYYRVKRLRVTSPGKTFIQADGDVAGELPAEISTTEKPIVMILPHPQYFMR